MYVCYNAWKHFVRRQAYRGIHVGERLPYCKYIPTRGVLYVKRQRKDLRSIEIFKISVLDGVQDRLYDNFEWNCLNQTLPARFPYILYAIFRLLLKCLDSLLLIVIIM